MTPPSAPLPASGLSPQKHIESASALLHAGMFEWAAWLREGDVGAEAGVPDPFISLSACAK
eukprot:10656109-Alexandrium_andersonii.AAC.1